MAVDVIIDPLTGQIYWNDSSTTSQSVAISGNGQDLIKIVGYSLQFNPAPQGAISVINGTTSITGSGTNFETLFGTGTSASGAIIYTLEGTSIGLVASVTNDTTLSLQSSATANYSSIGFRIAPPGGTDRVIFSDSATPIYPATTSAGLGSSTKRWSIYATDIDANGTITLSNALNVASGGTGATSFTSNSILLGNGTSAISTTSGTANQVLRIPSAGGAPSFGTIDLSSTSAVSGALSINNGGTNSTSFTGGTLLSINSAATSFVSINNGANGSWLYSTGTGTTNSPTWSTATLSTTFTTGDLVYANNTNALSGLSLVSTSVLIVSGGLPSWLQGTTSNRLLKTSGNVISWSQVDLTTDVSGILPISNGGTNATTATIAINNLLPTQTGNNGKYLTTDGTSASWGTIAGSGTVSAGTLNQLAYYSGTTTTSSAPGIVFSNSTTGQLLTLTSQAIGSNPLKISGTSGQTAALFTVANSTPTTVFELSSTGIITIGTWNASTIGINYGGTNTSSFTTNGINYYDGTSIKSTAAAASAVLVTNGSNVPTLSTDLPLGITIGSDYIYRKNGDKVTLDDGGTGADLGPGVPGAVIFAASTTAMGQTAAGTSGYPLLSAGASTPTWSVLGISAGGTGQTTATSAINALLPSQSTNGGKYLTTDGSNVSWATVTSGGSGTVSSGTANQLAYYSDTTTTASAAALVYSTTGTHLTITAQGNTISPLKVIGAVSQSAALFTVSTSGADKFIISHEGIVTTGTWQGSTIGSAYGGTGQTSYSNGELLIGNGTSLSKATLTAGVGIGITNGSGSITLKSPRIHNIVMAAGFNPTTGADTAVFRIPENPTNGTSSITYTLRNFFVRVETPSSGTSQIKVEKSSGGGAFSTSPTQLLSSGGSGTSTVTSNAIQITGSTSYEFYTTSFATTVSTGDLIRLNFSAVDSTHANFNINLLMEES